LSISDNQAIKNRFLSLEFEKSFWSNQWFSNIM